MERGTPIITDMQVIPVAGYDSMLLTLSGAHAPFFTRNIVLLTDSSGNTGLGEVHGGDAITAALEGSRELVVGRAVGEYKEILRDLGRLHEGGDGEGLQGLDLKKLQFVVHAETAVESALLDLLGKHLEVPVSSLLGDGRQRDEVEVLGYLFYIGEGARTNLDYLPGEAGDGWYGLRRREAMTPEAVVALAGAAKERYGFRHFKLKGGVMESREEMKAILALKESFPSARITLDPNGAWSLCEAIELCQGKQGILSYCEDPCSGEQGFSGREIRIITENEAFAQRLPILFRKAFRLSFDRLPDGEGKYSFGITDPAKLAAVSGTFGMDAGSLANHVNFAVLEEPCCRAAFFRGAFLSGGSVTDPRKGYHLELATSHRSVSREMLALLREEEFAPKDADRKGNSVIYFKQSEYIEDFLTSIGAPVAAMDVMTAKLEKDLRGSVNRRVNCDAANLDKVVEAAQGQLEAIRRLERSGRLETLPDKLQEAARLRAAHPEDTLSQLAEQCSPPVTKSALNHRLRKLVELGSQLEKD